MQVFIHSNIYYNTYGHVTDRVRADGRVQDERYHTYEYADEKGIIQFELEIATTRTLKKNIL